MLKYLLIVLGLGAFSFALVAKASPIGGAVKSSEVPILPAQEKVMDDVALSAEPIKWIDPDILKKLQAIKPAKNVGYTVAEVLALFPRETETVRAFLGDANVTRVYASTTGQMMSNFYGKGASMTGLDPNKPVYVFEGVHTRPIPEPVAPGETPRMSNNAQLTVVSDVNGNAMFTKTRFPDSTLRSVGK
jgi:hypothetical protein